MIKTFLIILSSFFMGQSNCDRMPEVRSSYGNIQSEQELENFIKLMETIDCTFTRPYEASATMQKAQFALAPWTKYNYFRKGKKMLEEYIVKYPTDIEARYIRFLIQTHAPFFLGYNHEIKSDAFYIRSNIDNQGLSIKYKTQILNHLELFENK